MGLLRRLLGGTWLQVRRGRPGATRKWAAGRRDHVEACAECRARQQRERQYLEKLRGAAVPEASEDLTARLLARTGQLAAERAATSERTAEAEREQTAPAAPAPARPTLGSYTCGTFSAGTGHGGTPRPGRRSGTYWTQRNGRARRTPPGPAIVRGPRTGSRQDTPCRVGQGRRDRSPVAPPPRVHTAPRTPRPAPAGACRRRSRQPRWPS